jgi:hypothetical protein
MHVVVIHQISDPEKFWGGGERERAAGGHNAPQRAAQPDGTRAVCLWEAGSLDAVKQLVEDTVGDVSNNEFFEVNAQNAQGLPS